ncbi:GCN5-related N-acetyltransferase [Bacillus cereus]|nr:GCN5-related N-acetyltransferase [Bacillus cereus]
MYTYKLQQEQPICAEKIKNFMILSVGGQKEKKSILKKC